MTNEEREKMIALDETAEKAGGYVINFANKDVQYDYRKLIEYCNKKGMKPRNVRENELEMFILR